MGQQPESGFQRSIQREIEKRGGYCVKQHGSMITAVGIPDLLVCYKGMFIALEAKVDNNKPSKAQGVNLRNILKAGGFTAVVWNIKEVKAPIKKGDAVGYVDIYANEVKINTYPITIVEDVNKGNFFDFLFRNINKYIKGTN